MNMNNCKFIENMNQLQIFNSWLGFNLLSSLLRPWNATKISRTNLEHKLSQTLLPNQSTRTFSQ